MIAHRKIYDCEVCWKTFSSFEKLLGHIERHPVRGICPICKEEKLLEKHHWSYKDYDNDKSKNTIRICNKCHGAQQVVRKIIRSGIPVIYIGHRKQTLIYQ